MCVCAWLDLNREGVGVMAYQGGNGINPYRTLVLLVLVNKVSMSPSTEISVTFQFSIQNFVLLKG